MGISQDRNRSPKGGWLSVAFPSTCCALPIDDQLTWDLELLTRRIVENETSTPAWALKVSLPSGSSYLYSRQLRESRSKHEKESS